MKYALSCMLFLATGISCFSQQQILSFIDPWSGAKKTAVVEDTLAGYCYITTAQTFNPHNKWALWRINLASNTADTIAGSDYNPGFITNKILYRPGFLYLLNDHNRVEAFNLATNAFTWSVWVDFPSFEKIYDFDISGDTVFVAGDFGGLNAVPRWSIAAINRSTGTIISSWDPSNNGTVNFTVIKTLLCRGGSTLFAGGRFNASGRLNLVSINVTGEFVNAWSPNPNDTVQDAEIIGNFLFITGNFTVVNSSSRNRVARIDLTGMSLTSFNMGTNGPILQNEVYPGTVLYAGVFTQIGSQGRINAGAVSLSNNLPTSWNPPGITNSAKLAVSRNRLYVLDENNALFQVWCLAPPGSPVFTTYDNNVCRGDNNIPYQVTPLNYAATWNWSYSGTGASISGNSNQVNISFSSSASSGSLTATPISYCGTAGQPVSLAITVNPRPAAFAGADTVINCYYPVITLQGSSASPNTVFAWSGPSSCPPNCPLFPVSYGGTYILTVSDTLTGCTNTDTVSVVKDTVLPNVTLPTGPFLLSCANGNVLLAGFSTNNNTLLWWRQMSTQFTFPDPYQCGTPGQYFLVTMDTLNGCRDSASLTVGFDINAPNAFLASLPDTFPSSAATFTCITDTIWLDGGSDTSNVSIAWKDISSQQLMPDPALVTVPGIYRMIVTRSDNGCADSSIFVLLNADTSLPLYQLPNPINLNCSQDSILLDAVSLSPNTSIGWSGPGNFSSPDPAWVSDTGTYHVTFTGNQNGCIITDSVYVGFDSSILVSAGADTLVCPGTTAYLVAAATGNFTWLSYLWSGIPGGQSFSAVVPADTFFILTVTDSTGCSGSDTVNVFTVPALRDSILLFTACDGSDSGTVQVLVYGGSPPYTFSLNGGPFQPSPVFSQVPFGDHLLIIRDSLGCSLQDSFTLNSSASPPYTNFLVRSLNESNDTIALVSVCNPFPDSVTWALPVTLQLLWSDPYNAFISSVDTGSFPITMTAWYPGCQLSVSKNVMISPIDTSDADPFNENGIKSLIIQPNPNNGAFFCSLEFFHAQDFVLQVVDINGVIRVNQTGQSLISWSGNLLIPGAEPGTYLLRVISEFDMETLLITVQ